MHALKINPAKSFQFFQVLKYSGQVVMTILLTKTYLQVNDLGRFESFLFVASSMSFFWVTGIMQALLSMYPDSENTDKNSLFFSSAILLFACSLFTLIFWGLFSESGHFGFSSHQGILLVIYLLINPLSFLTEYILLLKKK